jgi:hypothetical protein
VQDLDSDSFSRRQQATKQLQLLGEAAVPALRQSLRKPSSEEAARRATQLLDRLAGPTPPAAQLQALRAIEVLEQIGSRDALALLQTLARGMPEARRTQEAKASLQRLAQQSAPSPETADKSERKFPLPLTRAVEPDHT